MGRPLPKKKYERNAAEQLTHKLGIDKNVASMSLVEALQTIAKLKHENNSLWEVNADFKAREVKDLLDAKRYRALREKELVVMDSSGAKYLKEDDLDEYLDVEASQHWGDSLLSIMEQQLAVLKSKNSPIRKELLHNAFQQHIEEHVKFAAKDYSLGFTVEVNNGKDA